LKLKETEEELRKTKEELETYTWGLEKTNEAIRHLYKELEIKNIELKKLDHLKSEFVSTVSHELRTPLSIIKEGISLIMDEVTGAVNERQRKYLSISKQNVDRLERIINDLLNISKIEAGKIEIRKRSVLIRPLVEQLVTSFEPKAKERGLYLKTDIPAGDIEICADEDKVMQVLINLVGNALKFTEKGFIEISAREKRSDVEFSVTDTGSGIAKNDIPRVFDKFRQFGRQDGPGEKGTGLGLSISKGIVEMHGGSIWVESEPGRGTRFTFTIPKYCTETFFKEHVKNGLEEALKNETKMSVIYISIVDYEAVRQKLGKERFREVVNRLEGILQKSLRRAGDVAAKDTGELIAVVTSCDKDNVQHVKKRLEVVLYDFLARENLRDAIRLQFGYATYPDEARTDDDLIKRAREK